MDSEKEKLAALGTAPSHLLMEGRWGPCFLPLQLATLPAATRFYVGHQITKDFPLIDKWKRPLLHFKQGALDAQIQKQTKNFVANIPQMLSIRERLGSILHAIFFGCREVGGCISHKD